jgi:hypothetical protein
MSRKRKKLVRFFFNFFGEGVKTVAGPVSFLEPPIYMTLRSLLSVATIANVGLTCKLFLYSGLCSMRVNGLDVLKSVIDDSHRRAAGQGVVTGRLKLGCLLPF